MTKLLEASDLLIRPVYAFFTLAGQFEVTDRAGRMLGEIIREGWGDLAVRDADGAAAGRIYRPWVWFRTRVDVVDGAGGAVGSVRQVNILGRLRFAFEGPRGEPLADVSQDGFGAFAFGIMAPDGSRLGELTREFRFWRSGDYALAFEARATREVRLLSIALVVAADAAIQRHRRN